MINNLDEFNQYVLDEYPKEAVGFIVDNRFIPFVNIAPNPVDCFEVDSEEYLLFEDRLQAIVHSHTMVTEQGVDPRTPSKADMILAESTDLPQGILHTDGKEVSEVLWWNMPNPAKILGRPYISGVYDCHSIVRDYYRVHRGVLLPIMPRDRDWIKTNPFLLQKELENNLTGQGFRQIEKGGESPGDVLTMSYGTPMASHLAIYIGKGYILHHLSNRLSEIHQLDKFKRQHLGSYRYGYSV